VKHEIRVLACLDFETWENNNLDRGREERSMKDRTHDEAMAELFKEDPAYALELLTGIAARTSSSACNSGVSGSGFSLLIIQ
jgi:hypothetical protein